MRLVRGVVDGDAIAARALRKIEPTIRIDCEDVFEMRECRCEVAVTLARLGQMFAGRKRKTRTTRTSQCSAEEFDGFAIRPSAIQMVPCVSSGVI